EQYMGRGDSKRARAKLQICCKANPRELGTLEMLARGCQELGQTSKTVSVLKELARVHLDEGRTDDARKTWRQALELAPDDQEVKAALSSVQSAGAPRAKSPEPARAAAARPAPAAKPSPAIKPASPPAARQPVTPQPRPTAPIMGARPSSAPVSAARSVSAPPTVAQVPKLLKGTEVHVKY